MDWHQRNLIEKEFIDPDRALAFIPNAIICNSAAISKRFAKRDGRLPDKVHTIYNGVDTKLFRADTSGDGIRDQLGIARDDTVIGIASRFSRNKGHEVFLSAALKLIKESAPAGLKLKFMVSGGAVFAEDTARERVLRDLVKSMGLEGAVIFAGFRKDMPEVYAAMDIFVLASDAEPCGRVLFEAMASGKPIVATGTGGTPEIVSDGSTAILVPPRDPDAMADALRTLLEDRGKAEAMGRAGRRRVEELFSVETNARRTEDLYSALVSEA